MKAVYDLARHRKSLDTPDEEDVDTINWIIRLSLTNQVTSLQSNFNGSNIFGTMEICSSCG